MRLIFFMKIGKWNIKILCKFKFIKSFIGNLSLNYEFRIYFLIYNLLFGFGLELVFFIIYEIV